MSLRERTRAIVRALVLLCFLLLPGLAQADEPTITVTVGNDTRSFTRDELLARPTLPRSKWRVTSPIAYR
jgi:hypothetical protein